MHDILESMYLTRRVRYTGTRGGTSTTSATGGTKHELGGQAQAKPKPASARSFQASFREEKSLEQAGKLMTNRGCSAPSS